MRKKIALACAVAAAATLIAGACAVTDNLFDYTPSSPSRYTANYELDEGAKIDAVKEDFYGETSVDFYEPNSGITVKTWAHIGEKGLYLYSETDDTGIYQSTERAFFQNDMVEYYIDPQPALSAVGGRVRSDCLNLRINAEGSIQTYIGRGTSDYPWFDGYFGAMAAARVDGEINKANGATGYAVEAFIPWSEFYLDEKPEMIGLMPAFNNVDNLEDTSRTWFTVKGMSHYKPSGWAMVDANGVVDVGYGNETAKPLDLDWSDSHYADEAAEKITEVTAQYPEGETRGQIKAFLGDDGVYFIAKVYDKVLTRGSDSIWNNDGIELVIDGTVAGGNMVYRSGILRVGLDVDGGFETDIGLTGYDDYLPMRKEIHSAVSVEQNTEESLFGYRYVYLYELMVPYSTLGLSEKPSEVSFGWAIKTINEYVIVDDPHGPVSESGGSDWVWATDHSPLNPAQYYAVKASGITGNAFPTYEFPEWASWESCKIQSDSPTRYIYRGRAAAEGLYINVVQFVDRYVRSDSWTGSTHIELQVYQGDFGYKWDGTYFGFFLDGSIYCNNYNKLTNIAYDYLITDRGANSGGYRYEISYEIFLEFENNLANPGDGPYAYVALMSYTPGEGEQGYENSKSITKDIGVENERKVWADDCSSLEFRASGVVRKDGAVYKFPEWTQWDSCAVRSDAQTRYDYRGYAAENGLFLNVVQYVDGYVTTGANWTGNTHIEMQIWHRDFGYGAQNSSLSDTYLAFFLDGTYYINNKTNVDQFEYKVTITDRGADYEDGYRYEISYEIYIGFENNPDNNPQVGPYANVKIMSFTPGESSEGYEDAVTVNKDGNRDLWTDNCNYVEFLSNGASRKDGAPVPEPEYHFEWTDWDELSYHSDARTRYDYRGWADETGLYINVVQYVDSWVNGGTSGTWAQIDHVEMEIWQGDFGYGMGGTYFAFFPNGSYYVNNRTNVDDIEYYFTCADRGANFEGYRYLLCYEIYLSFSNDKVAPYGYAQIMSLTTDGNNTGYEGATIIRKDNARDLHTDLTKYTLFEREGVTKKTDQLESRYRFPEWTAWEECSVRSDAQTRYDYRGWAAADGLYLNVVQYVDGYVTSGANFTENTHIEMEIWQGDFGAGWSGTYMGFFLDGTRYINNNSKITQVEYRVTITDRGEGYGEGYRYMISYEIYIGFANNVNSQDGPYAYIKFMSFTPGETDEGYENATKINKDGNRDLWTDDCKSSELRASGVVGKDK